MDENVDTNNSILSNRINTRITSAYIKHCFTVIITILVT